MPKEHQHISPRHYLKGFASEDLEIYLKAISNGDEVLISTSNALVRKNFYTTTMPDGSKSYEIEALLEADENNAAPILDRLRRSRKGEKTTLTEEEKWKMSFWLTTHFIRTPSYRKELDFLLNVNSKRSIVNNYKLIIAKSHISNGSREQMIEWMERVCSTSLLNKYSNNGFAVELIKQHDSFVDYFFPRAWSLVSCPPGARFFTGQSPFYFVDEFLTWGLASDTIILPISSNRALFMTMSNKERSSTESQFRNSLLDVYHQTQNFTPDFVREINLNTKSASQDYIVYSPEINKICLLGLNDKVEPQGFSYQNNEPFNFAKTLILDYINRIFDSNKILDLSRPETLDAQLVEIYELSEREQALMYEILESTEVKGY